MPEISSRGVEMPASPIRKLGVYAEAAKKKGRKIYHLNIGQPDIKTPKLAIDAVKNIDFDVISYTKSAGTDALRKGLVNYYNKLNLNISHEDIIITMGGSEAMLFAFNVCLNAGDEMITTEPYYANYNSFAKTAGVNIVAVKSEFDDGFALPPIEEIEKSITSKTKAILICNPGNPTGYLYSKEELKALANIVKKHDLFFIVDEVYREFCYDGKIHHSVLSLDGIDQNTILLDSVSKRYSMCGARIGAFISRNKNLVTTVLKYAQARLSPPLLAQVASEAAVRVPQSYFDEVVVEYEGRRNLLIDGLSKIEGLKYTVPSGAFYVLVELPVLDAAKFCQWLLEEFEYNNETIMIAPASGFYSTEGLGDREVRIAYVLNKQALKNALVCLDEALKIYPDTIRSNESKMEALPN